MDWGLKIDEAISETGGGAYGTGSRVVLAGNENLE
jgi:hypothetical protein